MKVMATKDYNKLMQENFKKITQGVQYLHQVELDNEELFQLYVDSFPEEANPIFRERRVFDCNGCKNFIRRMGNVVVVKNGEVKTIWGFKVPDESHQIVNDKLNAFVLSKPIKSYFLSENEFIGVKPSREQREDGSIHTFEHINLNLDKAYVENEDQIPTRLGELNTGRNMLTRALEELTQESIEITLELISQNSLYKGKEWEELLKSFLEKQKTYQNLKTQKEKELFTWEEATRTPASLMRIRNTSIGTLLVNLSEGMELDKAVFSYENIVDPTKYKRPRAVFTKKMLDDAQKTVQDLGFEESLSRRYATLDDITVNNILFSNKDAAKRVKNAMDAFGQLEKEVKVSPKKFSQLEEMTIEDFIEKVLPNLKSLEAYIENKHATNFVSLIAPENKEAKSMFKWNNPFSWAYSGNITDSSMKERVKNAGGSVDGVLRFSIQWNDNEDKHNKNDLDAHCQEPNGKKIYFGQKQSKYTGGELDVDIQNPEKGVPAVENITWATTDRMKEGDYTFSVHNFAHRGGRDGFKAEIEFNGEIHRFEYNKDLSDNETITVATVTYSKNEGFSIKANLDASSEFQTKEQWGITTNQFVPVTVAMFSPNYWDGQTGVGHKHYFFMLDQCVNDESPNGFYNEFLKENLGKHKRVFEALGGKLSVVDADDQLSGIGFSSTKRAELVVKATGNTERLLKIKF